MYKVLCGDCAKVLTSIEADSVDLVVTSPPYDNLRDYHSEFDLDAITKELVRIVKDGGVIVWIVGDATIDGSETGTSFRQALKFMDAGFNLHDTMIFEKNSSTYPANEKSNRYTQIFEYMFVFSKGKPKTHHLICDKQNLWGGYKDFSKKLKRPVPILSPRTNIWKCVTSFNDRTEHPAPFPEQLALDHIKTWSNEKDVVLDPFMGSGTTGKMAILSNRNFIGIDISKEYCDIATKRIEKYNEQKLF
jgi:site-specific DNA-methyltransferase (adenine-specific)